MKKGFLTLLLLGAAYACYNLRTITIPPEVTTVTVARGSIVDTVGATGSLEAVTTVQVGTEVSGTVLQLYADFNSIVRRGDVIARLDPSLFETQTAQLRANLLRAEADLERLHVSIDDAKVKLARAEDLAAQNLIPSTELEAAQVTLRSTEAQLRSSQAQMAQAEASLNQAEVNLEHTVITAPIDGIVISRAVDVGQTVSASMQAPTLFILAADLTKMKVNASIDEAGVGRIRPGQVVWFTVDAYPGEDFEGRVSQVRLEAVVVQNVVTYATVIDVPNPDLKLKPGMTATVTLEIARRDDVIRIPNTALRFRPTSDTFFALGLPEPDALQGGRPGGGPRAAQSAPGGVGSRGGGHGVGRGPGGGGFGSGPGDPEQRRQLQERMQNMSHEEREAMMRQFGGRGGNRSGRGGSGGAPSHRAATDQEPTIPATERGATTIDALFGPLPPTESTGRLWVYDGVELTAARVRLGITDGSFTELLSGSVEVGAELVTGVITGNEGPSQSRGGPAANPFMPFGGGFRGRRR